jgi:hypothetical protein
VIAATRESELPVLYRPWIAALVGGSVPAESEATCNRCAMVAPLSESVRNTDDVYFDPRSKCCTYIPSLPNFLVGRILRDSSAESAAGRASVLARIEAGVGVTPAGLAKPPAFALLYRNAADAFGRAVSLRCPHYIAESGTCGIWRHRQSVCSTWFCKHVRGAVGQRFWESVRYLLDAVERSLASHCVLTLDPGGEAIDRMVSSDDRNPGQSLSASEVDGRPDPEGYRAVWGRFAGREHEFYEASARLIEGLSWNDVRHIGGAHLELTAALVRQRYSELISDAVPTRLRVGALTTQQAGSGHERVTAYSPWDPLVIPRALGDTLRCFDGRLVRSALTAAAKEGIHIDRAVVRRLVDFGVLVADEESEV